MGLNSTGVVVVASLIKASRGENKMSRQSTYISLTEKPGRRHTTLTHITLNLVHPS